MNIMIWADFVCPFCYIGNANLKQAIDEAGIDNVEIEYKSFQLDPNARYVEGADYWQQLADDKNMPIDQLKQSRTAILQMAEAADLEFNIDQAKHANTLDAHRLFQHAKQEGKDNAYFLNLYRAIFTDSLNVSDHETLADLAEQSGLDRQAAAAVLADSNKYASEVQTEITQAHQVGVQGVPFFVFNNQYAVSGAQPKETFVQVFEQLKKEA